MSKRYEELDDDLQMEVDGSDQGVLAKTLRNVGLLVVVCLVIALVVANGRGADGVTTNDERVDQSTAGQEQSASRQQPAVEGQGAASELTLHANAFGHFQAEVELNGTPVQFMVDTGATDIIISKDTAQQIGIKPHELNYTKAYQSANGVVRAAPVMVRTLRLGQIELYDVEVSVNEGQMGAGLLGMSFLRRLEGYEVRGDKLVLAW